MWNRAVAATALLALSASSSFGAGRPLALRHVTLDLPGPPSKVLALDLDRDGRRDLVVVVAYTEIEEIGDDRVEDLVRVTTVIPALFDRREVRAYLATAAGGYAPAGAPFPLPENVLHLEVGPPGLPLAALTDEGLAELRFDGQGFQLVPRIADPPVLARTRSFYPALGLMHESSGDGELDLLLPSPAGLRTYLGARADARREWAWPPRELGAEGRDALRVESATTIRKWYPLPEVRHVDGDGRPDLVFTDLGTMGSEGIHFARSTAAGEFGPLQKLATGEHPWIALIDLDGDGRAEAVSSQEQSRGDGLRSGLKDAKRPIQTYRFHRLREDLAVEPVPYHEAEIVGHAFEVEDEDEESPLSIQHLVDLDGDRRVDLVTVTLDFSVFQVLKILTTKRIGLGLDFHVYAQDAEGRFHEVPDLDLHEKLVIDLDDLKLGRFAQFAGDFDGDGRSDFVHLGRGRDVTIHTGRPGCVYPKQPDLTVRLAEEPARVDLVQIEDLDGDGRSDLRITRPLPQTDVDTSAPVRLDLYLSREPS